MSALDVIREVLENARRDVQLLDGRDFDPAPFEQATGALAALRADLTEHQTFAASLHSRLVASENENGALRAALDAQAETLRAIAREADVDDDSDQPWGYISTLRRIRDRALAVPSEDATAEARITVHGARWTQPEIDAIKARVRETKELMGWIDGSPASGQDRETT